MSTLILLNLVLFLILSLFVQMTRPCFGASSSTMTCLYMRVPKEMCSRKFCSEKGPISLWVTDGHFPNTSTSMAIFACSPHLKISLPCQVTLQVSGNIWIFKFWSFLLSVGACWMLYFHPNWGPRWVYYMGFYVMICTISNECCNNMFFGLSYWMHIVSTTYDSKRARDDIYICYMIMASRYV